MISRSVVVFAFVLPLLMGVGSANAQQNEWCGPNCQRQCNNDPSCFKEWGGKNKAKYGKYVSVCLKTVCKKKCDETHARGGMTKTECYGYWGRKNSGITD